MADPINPYLPSGLDRLSTMLMALGAGVSGAESRGQSGWSGLGPAAAMYGAANSQANQQAMQYAMWQQQRDELKAHQAVQEENIRSQIDERKRAAALESNLMGMIPGLMGSGGSGGSGGVPGMGMPVASPTIGPGADLLKEGPQKVAYLTEKYGLPPVAAAGVVGNLYQESGFRPNAVGDNGTAFGMGQWRGDRQQALAAFAQSQGKPPTDPQVQLDFVAHEGKNGDMGAQRAWAMLQTAKTPQDATTAMMHYFRPAGYTPNNPMGGHGFNNRVQYAQALMPAGAAPPNAQGQGDSSGGGAVPPGMQGPQIPNPPSDPTRYAPLALSSRTAPIGTILQNRDVARDKYNWDVYNATRDQTNKDRDYNFQVKKADSEGQYVRGADGVERFVPQSELRGTTRYDKPPDPGTPAGDVAVLGRALKDPTFVGSPEYAATYNRAKAHLIDGPNGMKYSPNMDAYPAPTFRQGDASTPRAPDASGMVPVGERNYTESQNRDFTYATRLANAIPQLEALVTGEGGKLSTARLPGNAAQTAANSAYYPEAFVGPEAKEFRRIVKDITSATLRRESGASIAPSEYASEYQKFIPQPGDSEQIIRNKLQALRAAAKSIAEGSGRPLTHNDLKNLADPGGPIRIDMRGNPQ